MDNKTEKTAKSIYSQLAKAFPANEIFAIIEPYLDVIEVEDDGSLIDFYLHFKPANNAHFYTVPTDDGIAVCLDEKGDAPNYIEDLKELQQFLQTKGGVIEGVEDIQALPGACLIDTKSKEGKSQTMQSSSGLVNQPCGYFVSTGLRYCQ